jgi:hypothetical protein
MARHGFADRPCRTVVAAAAHTVAIQAQDLGHARLGIRSRSVGPTANDVDAAIADRSVVRTWLMRSTIHLAAADDLRWLVRELGPRIRRGYAKRWNDLGLTAPVLRRAEQHAPKLLADGPLTRHEFAAGLRTHGLSLDHEQAPTHVLVHLGTTGLTCHADRNRFTLVDDWLPDAADGPHGDDALAELARRYFAAFSPATAADFTTWSGLPSARAIGLIRDELTEVSLDGRTGFRHGPPREGNGMRLLSAWDNFLIGYRDRSGLVPADRRGEIYVGGIIRPTIVQNGIVVGRWRLDRAARRVEIVPFVRVSRALRAALAAEVDDLGRFVGNELAVSVDT